MSGTTSVPRPHFGPAGFVAPDESAVLAGALADINAAFGGSLNTENLSTPQGQLASTLAAIVADKDAQFLFFASQCDPAFAAGRMQDAIARIYFITRDPARPTTVQALCAGQAGAVIPTGAQAKATDGLLYACTAGGAIGPGGSVTLPFACTATGPVACPRDSLNAIQQAVPGWESVTNPDAGVVGNDVESRAAFEQRRAASVALNGIGSLPSVLAAVLAVPDVLDAYAVENTTGAPLTIGGVSVAAHSLYVAVAGGDPAAVARAIWTKKSIGCGTVGNTTVQVPDPSYPAPAPSYPVSFQVPAAVPVRVAVTIEGGGLVPTDALLQVQAAVIRAFAGADGGPRARIGQALYASRFYAPVAALGAWAQVVDVLIAAANPSGSGDTGAPGQAKLLLPIDQVPVIAPSGITLALG